jgi:hypothetical protein
MVSIFIIFLKIRKPVNKALSRFLINVHNWKIKNDIKIWKIYATWIFQIFIFSFFSISFLKEYKKSVQCWEVELKVAETTKCRIGEHDKVLNDKMSTQKTVEQTHCRTYKLSKRHIIVKYRHDKMSTTQQN